ncbi:MAG: hypothetical protein R2784_00500 [Saprospiraceae bacterium]
MATLTHYTHTFQSYNSTNALMEVDVSTPYLKICENTDYTIKYCNKGAEDTDEAIVGSNF